MGRKTPEPNQFLSFFVAGQELAFRILRLCGVQSSDAMRPLASNESAVRGVLDYEANALPVIDVAAKFGLGQSPIGPSTHVMIVVAAIDGERAPIGVLVESINEGFELPKRRIQKAPSTMPGSKCLIGVGNVGNRSIPLIDVDRMLSDHDLKLIDALRSSGTEPSATVDAGTFNLPRKLSEKQAC
jgi:purine-binding chemotaxis protein CheW